MDIRSRTRRERSLVKRSGNREGNSGVQWKNQLAAIAAANGNMD
jgi:hypothetical protein